ncbi:MAG: helix-turn-helix domain-containing protein [Verrucomicrobia bacterium]|nr:helix-turn-helix domain-containing protein [Verrucomicrobiota bacterium]MCG2681512.1 helix-turn-helix domain-containing protein [Kiritimatiellia bacterium]MBU4248276.1 helix-turn-helix domain-containing protein [Verrucomicrobiota bacterium]MBU4289892.1 helix-turn-helix domain-containing protein [Verrucomicrobiota bacterium]MBU4428191.1 helix-turn-helix domain-containing protein [Verrucomicrobiota bacterium]
METIGQTLKKGRENKKMTVVDVAHATRAMVNHIQAIEADDFHIFPAPIYALGFIKLYAECVGLNPQPLMQVYRNREPGAASKPLPAKKILPVKKMPPAEKHRLPSAPSPTSNASELKVKQAPSIHGSVAFWETALQRIRWPEFKVQCVSLSAMRLPVETWKTILAVTGMVVLVVVAIAVFGWYASWKNTADGSLTSRWLQDPPAPYLNAE